jgi:NDP-sugar pyrophosphorylase family protein
LKALILAGGFGTRLRPLSCTRPKILFPVLNKTLLQWTLERLAKNNIKEAILAVNFQTEVAIKQHRIPKSGMHITYSRDPLRKPLGTGGAIKRAEKLLGHDEPFLVLNGDIFADVNYKEMAATHKKNGAIATLALCKVEDPTRYGVAELAKGNRIKRFIEKPALDESPSNWINAGAYLLSPEIFKYLPENRKVSIEREVFPKLTREKKLSGYLLDGLWRDIGKLEDYLEINKTLLKSYPQPKHKIKNTVKIENPVAIDKNVTIGDGSIIGPYAALGQGVTIGKKVHIANSIVFPETTISDNSTINGAIIGDAVTIGKEAKIEPGCILGDHVRIADKISLAKGVSVCPAKEITENVSQFKTVC